VSCVLLKVAQGDYNLIEPDVMSVLGGMVTYFRLRNGSFSKQKNRSKITPSGSLVSYCVVSQSIAVAGHEHNICTVCTTLFDF
jgi:hypothetical protein